MSLSAARDDADELPNQPLPSLRPLTLWFPSSPLSLEWAPRVTWWCLLLGVVERCVRYFLTFPLWEDECFLCVNLMDRSFSELLTPLDYHQVVPPLFLWIERCAVLLFGFQERSLRLFPFVCGLASLVLFRDILRRHVPSFAGALAMAIFACGYPGVRFSAEAKPYASDLFVSLALLWLAMRWHDDLLRPRWMGLLAVAAPIALGLSWPAVFVAAGISLFALRALLQQGWKRSVWLAWLAFTLSAAGSFLLVFLVTAREQARAEMPAMREFWQQAFVPWRTPLRLPQWLIATHTEDLLGFPIGSPYGGSTLTLLACATGVIWLVRRREGTWLLLTLSPFAAQFVAAALESYPYGGHVKFSQHLAPMICILAGLGVAAWADKLHSRPRAAQRLAIGALLFPVLVGLGTVVRDLARPYKTESDQRARAFAQWFWFNAELECETICLTSDLKNDFCLQPRKTLSWTAMYLCNQRIYSPRHRARLPPKPEESSLGKPVRYVLYRDPMLPFDQAGFEQWQSWLRARHRVVGQESFWFTRFDKSERTLRAIDRLEVWKCVQKE